MVILPMGERALLVEAPTLDEVLALHRRLETSAPAGVADLVPAARTVLVVVDPETLPLSAARAWIERTPDMGQHRDAPGPLIEVEVAYDGPDLSATAELIGIGPGELVRRHLAAEWRVAFTGFAPGFGYLVSEAWGFDVPRLDSPRTRVPAGAVGLAAEFTGAYPRDTPGGWRLIATTHAPLFLPSSPTPALLAPGTRVRFTTAAAAGAPGSGRIPSVGAHGSRPDGAIAPRTPGIRIVEAGLLSTVQDLGRVGHAKEGIARSGALDRAAMRTANRLVGNDEDAAGIEITMGGFRAVAERDLWFAVAGGWGPIRLDGRTGDPYEALRWPAGAELHIDWLTHGARAYLAVRGGIAIDPVAGSRSSDLMAGLGHPPLRAGDMLSVGAAKAPIPAADLAPWSPPDDAELELDLAPGPRADWFTPDALRTLYEQPWTVTNDADRVGMRLDGSELKRARAGELPSEGMIPGALQVPASGRPTILLADGPVTGGYPVIAVVTDASLDALAQARPGTRIRFRHAPPVH
jgi:KipI family sensor histidine kinase inhibitor